MLPSGAQAFDRDQAVEVLDSSTPAVFEVRRFRAQIEAR